MYSQMLINAISITNGYLAHVFSRNEIEIISNELNTIIGGTSETSGIDDKLYSYEEVQNILSNLNEKESIRKNKGVYYTPTDIVNFILTNSAKLVCGRLQPNNLHVMDLNGIPYRKFCFEKSVYDPTCGAGVFLLSAMEMKLDLLDLHFKNVTKSNIKKVVSSIKGNDLNPDSITITKIRLFLCVLHRYGVTKSSGLGSVLNACFENYDFVTQTPNQNIKYDIIIGNPPYVEDSKSESKPTNMYGNIYANVLENATLHLKPGGVIGFVIPLSYVSTPRMKKIRDRLYTTVPEQYILSYSDRPDCLFTSVHQKLCVLFGKNREVEKTLYTSNYRYWYKEERIDLFDTSEVVRNIYSEDSFIPKLGTQLDTSIYRKLSAYTTPILQNMEQEGPSIYLNMRAAFWIKAFLNEHNGSEYKKFDCANINEKNFCMCLLNSSLFWWYWICVSDCWHITRKELLGFKVPAIENYAIVNQLAIDLENELENTKLFVGTKQTEYEYKHKECVAQIHRIDDYINELYGLTDEESLYIKNFAYRYRVGGGVIDGCN
nr:N-6 DNA methylase [Clostridioides sp.]